MREADGAALVAAWKRSGLSMNAFGQKHGVTVNRLCYWRRRLEETKPSDAQTQGSFFVTSSKDWSPPRDTDDPCDLIEIVLEGHYRIRVPSTPGILSQVLRAIEEARS